MGVTLLLGLFGQGMYFARKWGKVEQWIARADEDREADRGERKDMQKRVTTIETHVLALIERRAKLREV